MIKLTRPDGSPIYFGGGFIVEPPSPGEAVDRARAKITYGGSFRFVTEAVAEVLRAIKGPQP